MRCGAGDERRVDVGETLIEILMTVVIVGLTFTALFASLATSGHAGAAQRDRVEADLVMRNYAEAAKATARQCTPGNEFVVDYLPPVGFAISVEPGHNVCPQVTEALLLTLGVTGPTTAPVSMQIRVRSP